MAALRYLFRRIRALVRAERVHAEIEAELDFHIDMRTQENVARGMAPDEARCEAERQFGRVSRIKEQGYDVRGARWLGTLWQDLRYGFRMLVQRPAFTAIAVATLGLGIGAIAAIFSVINTLLLRPLPVQNPEQLVSLNNTPGETNDLEVPAGPVTFNAAAISIADGNVSFDDCAMLT